MLKSIGKRIQQRRKLLGYTQEELADRMNVSVQMISNLERGNKAIRIDNLIALSKILKISTDYILTGKEQSSDFQEFAILMENLSERDKGMVIQIIHYCSNHP